MTSTVYEFLKYLEPYFPEMGGRVFEVTDVVDITKDTLPKMPLLVGAYLRTVNNYPNAHNLATLDETFMVELWYTPERYQKADGSESPFYAAFPHTEINDKVISLSRNWLSAKGARLIYQESNLDCSPLAIMLAIKFSHKYTWCETEPDDPHDGHPVQFLPSTIYPAEASCKPDTNCDPLPDCNKCPA